MFKTVSSTAKMVVHAALLAVASTGLAQAYSYTLDKSHTLVSFAWERAGLSRQQGRFTDATGTVTFDQAKPEDSTIDVTLRASSLQTGVEALDRHLRSADFFDVAQFPVITFKSTNITKTADKQGDVIGDLTMLGVTKPVKLQVNWIFTGPHPLGQINPALRDRTVSVFSVTGTIKRSDWGITRVIPLVSDEIQLTIQTELLKK